MATLFNTAVRYGELPHQYLQENFDAKHQIRR